MATSGRHSRYAFRCPQSAIPPYAAPAGRNRVTHVVNGRENIRKEEPPSDRRRRSFPSPLARNCTAENTERRRGQALQKHIASRLPVATSVLCAPLRPLRYTCTITNHSPFAAGTTCLRAWLGYGGGTLAVRRSPLGPLAYARGSGTGADHSPFANSSHDPHRQSNVSRSFRTFPGGDYASSRYLPPHVGRRSP